MPNTRRPARIRRSLKGDIMSRQKSVSPLSSPVSFPYSPAPDQIKTAWSGKIAEIGSPDIIYAKVNIDESNIAQIKLGQTADVQLNTEKNKIYKATVREILPMFDNASQSFFCKLYFNEPLNFNIVNTQLQSNILVGSVKNALLIPRNYIDFGGFVQVKGQSGKTKVTTGFISNNWVQILDGITENTVLITDNLATNKTTTSETGATLLK